MVWLPIRFGGRTARGSPAWRVRGNTFADPDVSMRVEVLTYEICSQVRCNRMLGGKFNILSELPATHSYPAVNYSDWVRGIIVERRMNL